MHWIMYAYIQCLLLVLVIEMAPEDLTTTMRLALSLETA